jgi:aminoglycoside phosphotransferase (APT) family kinase protein
VDHDGETFGGLLDVAALNEWIAGQDLPGEGPTTSVVKLQGGSQNNIFRLRRQGAEMVLRRPPEHLRENSNETMLREARVLGALSGSAVPHPELYGSCDDLGVIGCCFYLMAPIDGFTPTGELPDAYADRSDWRAEIPLEMVRAAAALGAVDYKAVGLEGFGRPDNWLERQVGRWRSQLEGYLSLPGYQTIEIAHVQEVGDWLDRHRPAECRIGIVHGDFQFANVMFSHDAPRLAATVDWELCSLGDPMLDMAWMLTAIVEPGDPPGRDHSFRPSGGLPSRDELSGLYGELTGRDMDAFPWFFVLACYKLGIILEGSHARGLSGMADPAIGDRLHAVAGWLLERARMSAKEA